MTTYLVQTSIVGVYFVSNSNIRRRHVAVDTRSFNALAVKSPPVSHLLSHSLPFKNPHGLAATGGEVAPSPSPGNPCFGTIHSPYSRSTEQTRSPAPHNIYDLLTSIYLHISVPYQSTFHLSMFWETLADSGCLRDRGKNSKKGTYKVTQQTDLKQVILILFQNKTAAMSSCLRVQLFSPQNKWRLNKYLVTQADICKYVQFLRNKRIFQAY